MRVEDDRQKIERNLLIRYVNIWGSIYKLNREILQGIYDGSSHKVYNSSLLV